MPPVTSASVTLLCPYASGQGRQYTLLDLLDLDAQRANVPNPTIQVFNNQSSIVEVIANPNGNNPLEFKIRTKAPKPANISSAIIRFDDGRTLSDGTPVPDFILTVNLESRPDGSDVEADPSHLPLVAFDEVDGAP